MTDEVPVGDVCEWDLSSEDLIEHKVHDSSVTCMALSGDRIVTYDDRGSIQVFNVSTCLLGLP